MQRSKQQTPPAPAPDPTSGAKPKRASNPSNRQKALDENTAAAAATTKANKEKRKESAARCALRNAAQPTVDQQRLVDQAAELERLKKELADAHARNGLLTNTNTELSAANTTLRSQATAIADNVHAPEAADDSIPAPKGQCYFLQRHMGLENNQELYDQLLSTLHEVAGAAKIRSKVTTMTYSGLDPIVKGQICQALREREPYLRRFSQNWAAYRLLHQYFKNARSYKKGYNNPNSAYARRRIKNTKKGWDAARARGETVDSSSDNESSSSSSSEEEEQPAKKRLRKAVSSEGEEEEEEEEEDDEAASRAEEAQGVIPVASE